MSIRKKGRRKIVCGDKKYIWYVHFDDESPYCILNVAAEDKSLLISCPLNMETPYIIIQIAKCFQGEKIDSKWKRRLLPFEVPEIITPGFVAKLIDWMEHGKTTEEVQWDRCNYPV